MTDIVSTSRTDFIFLWSDKQKTFSLDGGGGGRGIGIFSLLRFSLQRMKNAMFFGKTEGKKERN